MYLISVIFVPDLQNFKTFFRLKALKNKDFCNIQNFFEKNFKKVVDI